MRIGTISAALLLLGVTASASGQIMVDYAAVVAPTYVVTARPVVAVSPIVTWPAPVISYYVPAAEFLPQAAAPTVVRAPFTTVYRSYPAAAPQAAIVPVVTYRPVVTMRPATAPYYVGSGIVGQPKVYVPGQPVRNVLRFVTP